VKTGFLKQDIDFDKGKGFEFGIEESRKFLITPLEASISYLHQY